MKTVASSHLIITTSEKWDAVTRRWKEHIYLLGNVALLMVDEVHMLGDKDRGPTLESIICRMKTVRKAATEKALSVLREKVQKQVRVCKEQKTRGGAQGAKRRSARRCRFLANTVLTPRTPPHLRLV